MTVKQTQPTVRQQAAMWLMIIKQLAASYVWTAIGVGVVIGLILGLIFAWLIWPVRWTNAKPSTLSEQYQQVFLNNAANSVAAGTPIKDVAERLGEGWSTQGNVTDLQAVEDILTRMIQNHYQNNDQNLQAFHDALQTYGSVGPASGAGGLGISPTVALIILAIVLILVLLGALLLVRRLRSEAPRRAATIAPTKTTAAGDQMVVDTGVVVVPSVSRAVGGARPVEKTAWPGETRAPLTQFATTYAFGDDRYDMSSSIETSGGDFLGECGVGISETIGAGAPEKVTALEVWVFDKNDVRTVTKVLMSDYAFNDAGLRAKLAPKGDAILARPGEVVELKTQTLKINARIVDVTYGSSTPANSYFQQVTLELATWSDAQ